MPKKTYLLFLLVFHILACDSEQQEQLTATQITQISKLQKQLAASSKDSSVLYFHQLEQLMHRYPQVPDSILASQAYHKGLFFLKNGPLDSAAVYFHRAMDFVQNSLRNQEELAYFQNAWRAYSRLGQHVDCITVIDRLTEVVDSTEYNKMATIYYLSENTGKRTNDSLRATRSNQLRQKMLRLANNERGLLVAKVSQAELEIRINKDTLGAINAMELLIDQVEASENEQLKRYFFINYGAFLFHAKQFPASRDAYLKGLEAVRALPNNMDFLANAYSNLAEVYQELNDFTIAESYLDSVFALGLSNISQTYRRNTLKYKMQLSHNTQKDLSTLLNDLDSIFIVEDESYLKQKNKELRELSLAKETQEQLELDKQKLELDKKRDRQALFVLFIIFILLLVIGYLIYRQRKVSFEKESLLMQQRLLRSQMNPHFTFNTLYAIQNQIKKSPQEAKNYLLKFSRLLRLILENSTQNFIQLEKELVSLRAYLDLQLLRLPSIFEYRINLENLEEDDLIFIPPMLLQPLVENSIEHGFLGINYKGEINISLKRQDKYLFCEIEDNGVGISETEPTNKKSSTRLISNFLKKTTPSELKIVNKKKGSGLIVQFLIPYKLTDYDESDFD